MFSFVLMTTDNESLGLVAFAKWDWEPGDIIPQGRASLRVVDVIDADAFGEGYEVGWLKVEPVE